MENCCYVGGERKSHEDPAEVREDNIGGSIKVILMIITAISIFYYQRLLMEIKRSITVFLPIFISIVFTPDFIFRKASIQNNAPANTFLSGIHISWCSNV